MHSTPQGGMGRQETAAPALLLSMDDFSAFKTVGKGKDCVVYSALCQKLDGGSSSVVLKVYEKASISTIKHRSVRREARIMRYLTEKRIPHTTAYIGAFQDSKQIYIVMEHCRGGDLLEQLLKEGRAMPERRVVREVVLPTLTALAHLHAAGIIHRDIKLENLFISSKGHLQLGDFGLAISVLEERAISPVGTLEYMSPEILRLPSTDLVLKGQVKVEEITPIDAAVDVWSFGVTVYELVTGRSPFEGACKDEIKAAILGFQMRPLPGFLSASCQDFILKSLCPRPGDRPSALALLSHPWVQMHCTPQDLVTIARLPSQLPRVPMGFKAHQAQQQQQQQQQRQQQQAQAGSSEASKAAASGRAFNLTASSTFRVPLAQPPGQQQQQEQEQQEQEQAAAATAAAAAAASPNLSPSSTVSSPVADAAASIVIGGSPKHSSSVQLQVQQLEAKMMQQHQHQQQQQPDGGNGSARSNSALSVADSAASLCAPGQAAAGGANKGWPAAAGIAASSAAAWQQEPIQEVDEAAAAASSPVLQQQLQQLHVQATALQQPPAVAMHHGSSGAAGKPTKAHHASSSSSGANKLLTWMNCITGGPDSPTESVS